MGLNPARPDLVGRLRRTNEQMRQERVRPRGRTLDPTFIVLGTVTAGMVVPAKIVGINPDDETPEWKRLFGFAAVLQVGTADISWYYNGGDTGVSMSITDVSLPTVTYEFPTPIDLAHGDTIYPLVTSASGDAQGLSAAAFFTTAAG